MADYTLINKQRETGISQIKAQVAAKQAEIKTQAIKARQAVEKNVRQSVTVAQSPSFDTDVTVEFAADEAKKEQLKAIKEWEQQNIENLGQVGTEAIKGLESSVLEARGEAVRAEQEAIAQGDKEVGKVAFTRTEALKKLGNFVNVDNSVNVSGAVESGIIDAKIYQDAGYDVTQDKIAQISTKIKETKEAKEILQKYINADDDTIQLTQSVNNGHTDANTYIKAGYNVTQDDINKILNTTGEDVFKQMQEAGLVPSNAKLTNYDRSTGEIKYELPSEVVETTLTTETSETTTPVIVVTGREALQQLKDDGKVPLDAILDNYDQLTGKVTFHSPSQTEVTFTNANGKEITILQSEWDSLSKAKKLEKVLGRQPTLSEYQAMRFDEMGIKPDIFESMPVIGWVSYGLQKLSGDTRLVYNMQTGKMERVSNQAVLYWENKTNTMLEYRDSYPESVEKEIYAAELTDLGIPAAKVMLPQIIFKDVRGEEWLQSGIAVGSLAIGGVGGVAGKTASVVFKTGSTALGVGSTYLTAKHWDELSESDKVVSVITDALFFLPVLPDAIRAIKSAPNEIKVKIAYDKANVTANMSNKATVKWLETSPTDVNYTAIRDNAFRLSSEAKLANNTLVQTLKENPTTKMAKYIENKTILESANIAKLAKENAVVAQDIVNKIPDSEILSTKSAEAVSIAKQATEMERVAEQSFIDKFSGLNSADTNQLAKIEKQSGYTGLTDAVVKINNANTKINKAWEAIEASYVSPEWWKTQKYNNARNELQAGRNQLNAGIAEFDSVMKTKVKVSPSAGYEDLIRVQEAKIADLTETLSRVEQSREWAFTDSAVKKIQEDYVSIRGQLESAKVELNNLVKSRDAGLPAPNIEGYSMKIEPESPKPLSPDDIIHHDYLQRLSDESRAKYNDKMATDLEAYKQARTQVADKPQAQSSFTMELAPIYEKAPELARNTVKVPTIQVAPKPMMVKPVSALAVAPLMATEMAVVIAPEIKTTVAQPEPMRIQEVVNELALSTEQMTGRQELTEQQVQTIARVAVLTETQVKEASRTGLLYEVVTQMATVPQIVPMIRQEPITLTEALEMQKTSTTVATVPEIKVGTITETGTELQRATETDTETMAETKTATETKTETQTKVGIKTKVSEQIKTGRDYGKFIIPKGSSKKKKWEEGKPIPPATATLRLGSPRGAPDGRWLLVPPPYEETYFIDEIPEGVTIVSSGKGSAKETLQIIGGTSVGDFNEVYRDIGVTVIHIYKDNGQLQVEFAQDPDDAYRGKNNIAREAIGGFTDDEPEMKESTSVQTGLGGFGKEEAQTEMFAEVSGKESSKPSLIEVPIEPENKPLKGQIGFEGEVVGEVKEPEYVPEIKYEPIKEEKIVEEKKPKEKRTYVKQIIGKDTEAVDSETGSKYKFKYKVVDINDLIPSHTDLLEVNPNYTSELQPRIRGRQASRTQIDRMANNLMPELLIAESPTLETGAPIIGNDNMVESGNGRILAIRKAMADHPEQYDKYKKKLESVASEYGISQENLDNIEHPVLIRERETDVDRVEFVRQANTAPVLGMSPHEQAQLDSKKLPANVLSGIFIGEDDSIDQALRRSSNNDVVASFLTTVPANERAVLADSKGQINAQGLQRLKQAIFAKTYTGESGSRLSQTFSESAEPEIKTLENAMYQTLPDMAKAEALINSGAIDENYEVGKDLAAAIDMYARLKQRGIRIDDYLKQTAMFGKELTSEQEILLEHLGDVGKSQKKAREFISGIATGIENAPRKGQASLMDIEPITKGGIIKDVINRQRKEIGKQPITDYPETRTETERHEQPNLGRSTVVEPMDRGQRESSVEPVREIPTERKEPDRQNVEVSGVREVIPEQPAVSVPEPVISTIETIVEEPVIEQSVEPSVETPKEFTEWLEHKDFNKTLTEKDIEILTDIANSYPEYAKNNPSFFGNLAQEPEETEPISEGLEDTTDEEETDDTLASSSMPKVREYKDLPYKDYGIDELELKREQAKELSKPKQPVVAKEVVKQPSRGLGKQEIPEYRSGKLKVFYVNGEYIKKNLLPTWAMGGHDLQYPTLVPANEIWLDKGSVGQEDKYALVHLLAERQQMAKGVDYATAHDKVANVVEKQARDNPNTVQGMIKDFLLTAKRDYDIAKYRASYRRKLMTPKQKSDDKLLRKVNNELKKNNPELKKQEHYNDRDSYYLGYKILPPQLGGNL
jgi:hypothetical protein